MFLVGTTELENEKELCGSNYHKPTRWVVDCSGGFIAEHLANQLSQPFLCEVLLVLLVW